MRKAFIDLMLRLKTDKNSGMLMALRTLDENETK
jgi:hypothetical protein